MANKPDLLEITTVSKTGKFSKRYSYGSVYADIHKGKNTPFNQIAIEVQHTTGVGHFEKLHERESALINITFATGEIWAGDFNQLKHKLLNLE